MNEFSGSTAAAAGLSQPDLLKKILEATREGVLVVRADFRIVNFNAAAEIAFGRAGMLLSGKRLTEVLRDLDLHEAFGRALVGREASDVRLEMIGVGRHKYDVHIAPIEFDSVPHAIAFFYDTTQIERLESVRQEFLSNISHELRTPLTSILAFVETLEDGAMEDEENNRRFLGVIRRNAERMRSLIADILELSRIESGEVSIEKRPVSLADITSEVFISLSARASEREIAFINSIPADTRLAADPVRLEQMLTNLVDNAIKFNRRGGSVTVSAQITGRSTALSVTDTGEGILPEHVSRIFERFYRVDRARSREVGGTGLGLAIVKHLVRLHGGEIGVHSQAGGGTTFVIELPNK